MKLSIWMLSVCFCFCFHIWIIFNSVRARMCVQCFGADLRQPKQTHSPRKSDGVLFRLVFIRNEMRKRLYISLHIIDIYLYVHVERWQRARQSCLVPRRSFVRTWMCVGVRECHECYRGGKGIITTYTHTHTPGMRGAQTKHNKSELARITTNKTRIFGKPDVQ